MELTVTVSKHLSLNAGSVIPRADMFCILPPDSSLFDQLCAWLNQCPLPTAGIIHWVFGIGATALCLRWGTYLAVLMDETKAIDFAYRNGPIEYSHAGREAAYPLNCRRFTDRQARQIIWSTAECLSPFVSAMPLWDEHLANMPPWPERIAALPAWRQYPHNWAFTESSSWIRLKQEWTAHE